MNYEQLTMESRECNDSNQFQKKIPKIYQNKHVICRLTHFQDFGHSFSLYGLLIKVKENFDETRIMMKGMKIVNYN